MSTEPPDSGSFSEPRSLPPDALSPLDPLRPVGRVGPFLLEERIGRGGMGEVWRARHEAQGTPVAIKLVGGEASRDDWYLQAFRTEVRAVARLNHPNIVMVVDHGELDRELPRLEAEGIGPGSPWLAMELLAGRSLMRSRGRLGWDRLYAVLLALLDALAHAHARGLVHRDLKPGNVLLSDAGQVKLLDFGLAHVIDEAPGEGKRSVIGTAPYMAPEQLRARALDYGPWTDLYALGGLAWTLVCGEPPFGLRRPFKELREAHLRQPLPALDPVVLVPDGFEEWLGRLLEKDPARRFRRAADAAWALRRLAPVRARVAQLESMGEFPTLNWSDAATITEDSHSVEPSAPEVTGARLAPVERPPLPSDWHRPEPARQLRLEGAGLGLYGLREIPLVNRSWERDLLWGALHGLSAGRPGLVLLQGAAGCGKTRLARWLCERGHELGAAEVIRVTHARGGGAGDGLVAGLSRWLRCGELPRHKVFKRVRESLAWLGVNDEREALALTSLLRPGDGTPELPAVSFGSARERYALLGRFVAQLARLRPVILRVEDVQWGAEALGFARWVSERADMGPVLLLLTAREMPPEQLEARLLEALMNRPGAQRVPVGPLDPGHRSELIRRLIGLEGELAERLEQRTAGNPLFIVQLVGEWVQRGFLEPGHQGFRLREGAAAELPDDLHAVLQGRVDRVLEGHGPRESAALELAAALGMDIEPEEWREACHIAGAWPSPGLVDDMLGQGLAESDPEGPQFGWSFVHGLLRESLERRAREGGRAEAHHRACAEMLRGRVDADPRAWLRLGEHLLAVGDLEEALEPLRRGAWRAVVDSEYLRAERALALREGAVGRLDLAPDDRRPCEGWLMRARVARRRGHDEGSARWAVQAESVARRQGWRDLHCQALRERARLADHRGDRLEAMGHLEEAVELAAGLRAITHAWCQRDLGLLLVEAHAMRAAKPLLANAETTFERAGEVFGQGNALQALARVAAAEGDADTAEVLLELAEQCYRRSLEVQEPAHSWVGLADIAHLSGDLKEAERRYERALARFAAIGSAAGEDARLRLAVALLERDRPRRALPHLDQLAEDHRAHGRRGRLGRVEVYRAWAEAEQGHWLAATDRLEAAKGLLRGSGMVDGGLLSAGATLGALAETANEGRAAGLAWRIVRLQWLRMEGDEEPLELNLAREGLARLGG